MTKLCICQICNCGRHRCPHNPQRVINRGDQPCSLTEYARKYIPHPLEMRQSMKPEPKAQGSEAPLDDKTTHRCDYIKHPFEKPFVRPTETYVAPEGTIDDMTNYTKEYTRKPFSKVQPIKKGLNRREPGKFCGDPTYKSDYRKFSADRTQPIKREQEYRPNSQPFKGQSHYTDDYIKHCVPPRESMKPAEKANMSDEPFAKDTGYKIEYNQKPIPPREKRDKAVYKANKNPFDSITNYKKEYVPKDFQNNPSCKPDASAFQSDAPLNDQTTHRADYTPKPYEKPYVRQSEAYVKPEGKIDDATNYTQEYTKKPFSKVQPIKKGLDRREPGKFCGDPTYKSDYRKFSADRTQPIKREQEYRPNSQPFQGQSHYTDDYIKHCVPPRESMKPAEKANMSDEPFAKDTGYKIEYNRKPIPPREKRDKAVYKANKNPFDGATNYTQEYVPKDFQNNPSCKPDASAFQSDAPLNDETTHRADYTPKPYEKPFVRQGDAYVKPEGNFDFDTTHKREYTPKPIYKTETKRPVGRKSEPGKFDDGTNYKKDFRKWPLAQRPEYKHKDEYVPNDARFEGQPTYTQDFIEYNERPRQSMKPVSNAHMSQEPFCGLSEYKDDYTKKPLPERFHREIPKYAPNKTPFEGLTNYKGEYVPKDIRPQPSCKPDATAFQSDAPLDDHTTFRTDFQRWPAQRPFVHEQDKYIQPEGIMEKDTTHKLAYTPKYAEKTQSKRPEPRKSEPGKFQDCTTNKEDFRKWGVGERTKPKMKDEYVPMSAPFEGTSNYTDNYIRHPNALRTSMKPDQKGMQSDAPFDGCTEYKVTYTGKMLPPCPAGVLEAGGNPKPGFDYVEQDPAGHKWFQPHTETTLHDLKNPSLSQAAVAQQMTAVC